ncbi:hypothetical protein FJZ19_03485 [Candidatus Pacearchaeota archaeon]|nr:hypothetical protein [Candidatus Pacearchaeota archaeon]
MGLEEYFPWVFNSEWYRGKNTIGHISVLGRSLGMNERYHEQLYQIIVTVNSDGTEHRSKSMKKDEYVREVKSFLKHLASTGYNVSFSDNSGFLSQEEIKKALTSKPDSEPSS